MYITKTLALPHLDETDCLKITKINISNAEYEENRLLKVIKELLLLRTFDISDDELLFHICVSEGLFSHRDWQNIINNRLAEIANIDYEVDPTKKRPSLTEDIFLMSGSNGSACAEGYKMLLAISARELVFKNEEGFKAIFKASPREYIEEIWRELKNLCDKEIIIGKYTDELRAIKHHY